jgi:hypothetical protein
MASLIAIAASFPLGSIIPKSNYLRVYTYPTFSLAVVPPIKNELFLTANFAF